MKREAHELLRRLHGVLREPASPIKRGGFALVAAAWLCVRLALSYRRDSFRFWIEVGLCGLCTLVVIVDWWSPAKHAAASRSNPIGIEVWMPLAVLGAFLVLGLLIGIATAR